MPLFTGWLEINGVCIGCLVLCGLFNARPLDFLTTATCGCRWPHSDSPDEDEEEQGGGEGDAKAEKGEHFSTFSFISGGNFPKALTQEGDPLHDAIRIHTHAHTLHRSSRYVRCLSSNQFERK